MAKVLSVGFLMFLGLVLVTVYSVTQPKKPTKYGLVYQEGIKLAQQKCASEGGLVSVGTTKERIQMVDEIVYLVTCANGEQRAFIMKG